MRLHFGELREAAPVGFVAPDLERRVVHRIVAAADSGAIGVPAAAMDHDVVADLDVGDRAADLVHHAGGIAAADVKIGIVELGLLARRDHVHRGAARGPHVVEVDPGRHHVNQHLVRLDLGDVDLFDLERVYRLAIALGPDYLRVHFFGHLPEGRNFADFVDLLVTHATSIARCPEQPLDWILGPTLV
jgi:hypothetical protein